MSSFHTAMGDMLSLANQVRQQKLGALNAQIMQQQLSQQEQLFPLQLESAKLANEQFQYQLQEMKSGRGNREEQARLATDLLREQITSQQFGRDQDSRRTDLAERSLTSEEQFRQQQFNLNKSATDAQIQASNLSSVLAIAQMGRESPALAKSVAENISKTPTGNSLLDSFANDLSKANDEQTNAWLGPAKSPGEAVGRWLSGKSNISPEDQAKINTIAQLYAVQGLDPMLQYNLQQGGMEDMLAQLSGGQAPTQKQLGFIESLIQGVDTGFPSGSETPKPKDDSNKNLLTYTPSEKVLKLARDRRLEWGGPEQVTFDDPVTVNFFDKLRKGVKTSDAETRLEYPLVNVKLPKEAMRLYNKATDRVVSGTKRQKNLYAAFVRNLVINENPEKFFVDFTSQFSDDLSDPMKEHLEELGISLGIIRSN